MGALVTGGTGFIGGHLVDKLVELGWDVIVIDDLSADSNVPYYNESKLVTYYINSICETEALESTFKEHDIDCVFHLAAESRIPTSIKDPVNCTNVNVVGTCNLLQVARKYNVSRFIMSSTSSAYGLTDKIPQVETLPVDCLNPYSVTKVSAESLCKMYTNLFDLETIIFRYFNVYGDRAPIRGQYCPVVGRFLDLYKAGKSMTIVGDGEQRRDYVNVLDVVDANILAAQTKNKDAIGELINIGTGTNYSVNELAKLIGGAYNYIDNRPGEARVTLADISKAKTLLGWLPKNKLQDYIKEKLNDIT